MSFHSLIRANWLLALLAVAFIVSITYAGFVKPPLAYPSGDVVIIKKGATISETATILKSKKALHSPFVFSLLIQFINGAEGVHAGTYALFEPENVLSLAVRFSEGATGITPYPVTIPEGFDSRQIAHALKITLKDFDADHFLEIALENEGYLFPDTYRFLPGTTPEVVVETMKKNFNDRVKSLEGEVRASGHTLDEIVTMASIIEREARKFETRQIVSGILWKRIQLGMPLQVDAVFGYILGKSGYSPTFDDLKIDSPYNTYTNRGLPPHAIANPGLESITATLRPTETPYLYYLTGRDGKMYYSKTFEQHVANRPRL